MPELAIEWRALAELAPYPGNARTHSGKQIHQIAASIREFGFTNPVLVDQKNTIIAGHGRVEAAKELGLGAVPTIRLEHLSEVQKQAYIIADNRLAEIAGWDREVLAIELQNLVTLDFEVELTGFSTAEIDLLIDPVPEPAKTDPADVVPEVTTPAITRPGDLWQLGRHRLLCASALEADSYARLAGGKQASMVFADPPYNVPIGGHVCGSGRIHHREFAMASGELSEDQFVAFLARALEGLASVSADGALLYVCMDWRHLFELLTAGRRTGLHLLNLCVWNKDNGGMGSFYRSKHELIGVFKTGDAPHLNTIELGRFGRYRTNVWDYAGVNTLRPGRMAELSMHPTVKPVALVADAIKDCTRRGDIVLDAFLGSGTTLIAAEKTGRCGYALEIDPTYVDTAIRRWERLTGEPARHVETNKTFAEMVEVRQREMAERAQAEEEAGHGA